MRILVTGSAGFIGYHLCKELLADGYEVLGIDSLNDYYDVKLKEARLEELSSSNFSFKKIDISNREDLQKSFEEFNPRKVVNLAAQAGVRYSIKNPYAYLASNLRGFLNVIEMCRNYKVEGLIYASSSSVYGANKKIPFDVKDSTDKPLALYGATKKANELIAFSYSHLYGLNTTGLRFFTVYGPWGRPDMAMFIFAKNIISNKSIPVYNNGDMRRDFTYIDDIIHGTKRAIEKNYKCEIFNLGNNKSENLMDMISIMEHSLSKKAIVDFQPIQPGDVKDGWADIDYSFSKLGYQPKTDIKEGIPKFLKWYGSFYV